MHRGDAPEYSEHMSYGIARSTLQGCVTLRLESCVRSHVVVFEPRRERAAPVQTFACSLVYRSKDHAEFAHGRFWWTCIRLLRCTDGYTDLGLASGLWLSLGRDDEYSPGDIAKLTVMLVASCTDLTVGVASIFIALGDTRLRFWMHVTCLVCECAILGVMASAIWQNVAHGLPLATSYFVLSALSTCIGFALSVYGVQRVLSLARRVSTTVSRTTTAWTLRSTPSIVRQWSCPQPALDDRRPGQLPV